MQQKSLKKNFVFNFLKTLMGLIFPLITFPYASRVLLPEGIGKVNFAKSIIAYFILIASLGISAYAIREGARIRDNKEELSKFVQEVFLINLVTTGVSYILFFISLIYIPKFEEYKELLLIFSMSIVFTTLGIDWVYGALEEYKYITIRTIAFQFISLILLFIFVRKKEDYLNYAVISVFSNVGSNLLNFIHARKYINLKKKSDYNLKRHIKPILIIFGMNLAVNVYANLDTTMLGFISGDTSVGIYTASIKVNKLVLSLITSLGTILLPRLSYYIGNNEIDKFNELTYKAFNFILMFSIPSLVGLTILSKPVISIFSGDDFQKAILTMKIITPIIMFISLSNLIGIQIFMPMKKEKYALYSVLGGAAINFILNLILIPQYNENGAAISTVFAEGIVAFIDIYLIKNYIDLKKAFSSLYQYIIGSVFILIIGSLIVFYINNNVISVITTVLLSIISYLLILIIFKNKYCLEYSISIINKIKKWGK